MAGSSSGSISDPCELDTHGSDFLDTEEGSWLLDTPESCFLDTHESGFADSQEGSWLLDTQ